MPDFAYVGLDTAGRERRGSVRAETREAARDQLAARKLYVVRIEPARRERRALAFARPARAPQARRQAAHPLHPPARHPDPGHPARRGAAHHLAPGRARGGAPRARQRPCRRGRGPPPLRGDGARAGELPAALPGDGLGGRILGHPAADPRAAREPDGAPGAGPRQGPLDPRLSDHPRDRRGVRGLRPDDLRRAQGGRAIPGYRPVAAFAHPDRDRPLQLPCRLVVGAAARPRASSSSLPAARSRTRGSG